MLHTTSGEEELNYLVLLGFRVFCKLNLAEYMSVLHGVQGGIPP